MTRLTSAWGKRALVFAMVTAVVAVGAWARFVDLRGHCPWLDEVSTLTRPQEAFWPAVLSPGASFRKQLAYYALTRAVFAVTGPDVYAMRYVSAAAGVAGVLGAYALGKRLWSSPAGAVSAAALACNVGHMQHSREARGYALGVALVLWGAVAWMAVFRQHREEGRVRLGTALLAGLLGALPGVLHYAVLPLTAAASALAALVALRTRDRSLLLPVGIALAVVAPVVPLLWLDFRQGPPPGTDWIAAYIHAPPVLFKKLFGPLPSPRGHGGLGLLALGAYVLLRRPRRWPAICLLGLCAPVIAALYIGHFRGRPFLTDRYLAPYVALVLTTLGGAAAHAAGDVVGALGTRLRVPAVAAFATGERAVTAAALVLTLGLLVRVRPENRLAEEGPYCRAVEWVEAWAPGPGRFLTNSRTARALLLAHGWQPQREASAPGEVFYAVVVGSRVPWEGALPHLDCPVDQAKTQGALTALRLHGPEEGGPATRETLQVALVRMARGGAPQGP